MNTFADEHRWQVDARLAALAAGLVALRRRAAFIVVVLVGAVTAALVRLPGWS